MTKAINILLFLSQCLCLIEFGQFSKSKIYWIFCEKLADWISPSLVRVTMWAAYADIVARYLGFQANKDQSMIEYHLSF